MVASWRTATPTPSAAASSPASATAAVASSVNTGLVPPLPQMKEFPVGDGQGPHDVAPAVDGGVWYTAQRTGELGYLDPKTGAYRMINLGNRSAPHGANGGPDG